jgi:hypothetical protein
MNLKYFMIIKFSKRNWRGNAENKSTNSIVLNTINVLLLLQVSEIQFPGNAITLVIWFDIQQFSNDVDDPHNILAQINCLHCILNITCQEPKKPNSEQLDF